MLRDIGGIAALVVVVATAVAFFVRLEFRVGEIAERQESLLKSRQEQKSVVVPEPPSQGVKESCAWQPYMSRVELENIQECPEGSYVKGVGFRHPFGQDLAYQMDYRLYCCTLLE